MRVHANSPIQGLSEAAAKAKPSSPRRLEPDQAALDGAAALRQALEQTPEVRADKVAQAKALAADPTYPSSAMIDQIAAKLAQAPWR